MDVILARAGLSGAQQRAVCLGAVKDEVKQTETKLVDALAALRRLQEVARVARDVHKAQASSTQLSAGVEASVARMTQSSRQFAPLLTEIHSTLNAFSSRGSRETTWSSTEEEEEEATPSERTLNEEVALVRLGASKDESRSWCCFTEVCIKLSARWTEAASERPSSWALLLKAGPTAVCDDSS